MHYYSVFISAWNESCFYAIANSITILGIIFSSSATHSSHINPSSWPSNTSLQIIWNSRITCFYCKCYSEFRFLGVITYIANSIEGEPTPFANRYSLRGKPVVLSSYYYQEVVYQVWWLLQQSKIQNQQQNDCTPEDDGNTTVSHLSEYFLSGSAVTGTILYQNNRF